MNYSSIGVSGFDLVFMNSQEREVFYERIPLMTSREIQTLSTTLMLNKQAIENLHLEKSTENAEFKEAYSDMQKFKQRFFNTCDRKDEIEEFDLDDFTEDAVTNEFTDVASEDVDMESFLSDITKEISEELSPLEELEVFIRARGRSKDMKQSIDERVVENNFGIIQSKYNMIPLDVSPLEKDQRVTSKYIISTIKALSKKVYMCDNIISQMRQEGNRTLIDLTVRGKIKNSMQRIGIYRRFSERKKTRDEVVYALSQIARQLTDISTAELEEELNNSAEFSELYDTIYYNSSRSKNGEKDSNRKTTAMKALVPLFNTMRVVQMREFKEVFGTHQPDAMDVIECSRVLAVEFGITGLLPDQEITLVKSIPAFSFKPKTEPPTPEVAFVLRVLAMSLVSEKYDMTTGVQAK